MVSINEADSSENNNNNTNNSNSGGGGGGSSGSSNGNAGAYECNICLDTAREAVISMCGHLFCWPCLHKWLETRPNNQTCPVCKSAISKEKVIPLYGRDSGEKSDPRDKVPPRPQGQRSEPQRNVTPRSSFTLSFDLSLSHNHSIQYNLTGFRFVLKEHVRHRTGQSSYIIRHR